MAESRVVSLHRVYLSDPAGVPWAPGPAPSSSSSALAPSCSLSPFPGGTPLSPKAGCAQASALLFTILLLFPSPGDVPTPGTEPRSPTLQTDSLPAEPPAKTYNDLKAHS